MREALEHYKIVVFLDADVVLPHLHVPLEWLLNYWDINPETLVAMAWDPEGEMNNDNRGRLYLNTGFVIAQQSPRTKGISKRWDTCLDGSRYPECPQWSNRWPHEQGAFGTHVRYEYDLVEDVKALPCAEANGWPEASNTECLGRLVRHYWGAKHLVASWVQESVLRYVMPRLHDQFLREYQHIEVKWNDGSEEDEENVV
ncbi:hypothetical protein N7520_011445 [Penicillium odoratum]|uniref:uncharacterized protein n=1 Tax=Penicillium odoratum TaxID=1167516 RepID=UPI002549082A|nr:uncharacterized protein N7520_011445 [Penicillium odoratum]KAJ5746263.1 hypothetical protein N7520_011445 [Penicillium odoratum]